MDTTQFRPRTLAYATIVALGLAASGYALADEPLPPEITSPGPSEIIYQATIELIGSDEAAADNTAQWAVRKDTCAASTDTVAGNVDGFDDQSTWEDGFFTAFVDATSLASGEYCFVLNTQLGPAAGSRLTQVFYLVDEYAKVSGTIYLNINDWVEDGEYREPRGANPTHAFDGAVGTIGDDVLGSITVNYWQLDEYVTYDPDSLTLGAAPGVGVTDTTARAQLENDATILLLDRNAASQFPRGAIVVRPDGNPGTGAYEIDSTPGEGGAASWVPLERGNVEVGVRPRQ